jgi:hypothetical protein
VPAALYRPEMTRILLAILALMTGLVAQAGPAQARMNGVAETEIGASDNSRSAARTSATQGQPIDAPVAQKERRERDAQRVRPARGCVFIPSVLLGVDRALE